MYWKSKPVKMDRLIIVMFLYLFPLIHTHENDDGPPTVVTKLGTIIGTIKEVDAFGRQVRVERYFGIPYAEPPIGDLRFRKPVPKEPFTSPYRATQHGNVCHQSYIFNFRRKDVVASEDCLFLNVYAPAERKKALAVMIWIHGGGFVAWESDPFVSDTLVAHGNVIVVTINYRLSLWGFLSTGDEHSAGNYGLFDQHMAIQWVHDNIKAFGGDPRRVTIFGESSGAASVVYQSMFQGNRDLFQRAIAQSGSASAMWASTDESKQDAEKLGSLVGCENLESGPLIDCLRNVPVETLNETLNEVKNGFTRWPCPFVPTVDGEFVKKPPKHMFDADSDEESYDFFSTLDFLTGMTDQEGALAASPVAGIKDAENFTPNRTDFEEKLVPQAIAYPLGTNVPKVIKDLVVHEYTDWTNPENTEKIRNKFMQIYADFMFSVPMLEVINCHATVAQTSKRTYQYVFAVKPSVSVLPAPAWIKGAAHIDDVEFIFFDDTSGIMTYLPWMVDYRPEDWEKDIAKYMMTMWSNFAKTG